MADFFAKIWDSVITPGPTPLLLKATNATFAALQLLLLALLCLTYSIHFVVLSLLSGGLWWAINWFAVELEAAQDRERAARPPEASEDSETEVEGAAADVPRVDVQDLGGVSGGVEVGDGAAGAVRRREVEPGTQSSASTEDEWEKVSENEKDKQK